MAGFCKLSVKETRRKSVGLQTVFAAELSRCGGLARGGFVCRFGLPLSYMLAAASTTNVRDKHEESRHAGICHLEDPAKTTNVKPTRYLNNPSRGQQRHLHTKLLQILLPSSPPQIPRFSSDKDP